MFWNKPIPSPTPAPRRRGPSPEQTRSAEAVQAKRSVLALMETEDGIVQVAAAMDRVLYRDAARVKETKRIAERARFAHGCRVQGDDLVHPTLGTFVGVAKQMQTHPNNKGLYFE